MKARIVTVFCTVTALAAAFVPLAEASARWP
jgi:hypothetical protein